VKFKRTAYSIALSALIVAPVYAQSSTAADVQRDANQEQRIDNGLQSGQLNTREAGQLQHEEAHVDAMQQKADHNGSVSPREQSQINAAQNRVSHDVYADKHNGVTGNPDSASSERMQADVQRDQKQQQRIANGVENGSVSNREAGGLERGQAHDDRTQSRVAANGHISADEQHKAQQRENHQSQQIHRDRHDSDHPG
jgi:hypothetical protein